MEFRVLGPLEVVDEQGTPRPVTAPMLRALLTALVLRTGRTVPADELADQIWGQQDLASVRTTLRTYVMRLRRAVPGDRIRTVPGGYRLAAGRDETDLGRFQDLLDRSRALAPSVPAEAAALLDRALALWRGAPLADLGDCPLRTVERPRLEELRLTAVEERFELQLSLGRHELVADELGAEARRHPLRERLTRQLMLALHRCGRTAEALAAYRAARRALVDELSLEPGPELRELHQAILRADPALAAPEPVPDPGTPPSEPLRPGLMPPASSPHRFPAGVATFVARGVELARMRELLTGAVAAPAVCLIDGPGGVGKSALAVRAAHEVADRFPGGLLHVDLRGSDPHGTPLGPADALRTLLPGLGMPQDGVPQEEDEALELYRERLRSRRALVVLDNAMATAQVLPLLPTLPGCAAVVTSRTVLTGLGGAQHLHLEVLDTPDAVALVRAVSGRPADLDEPRDWEELAGLCGRLPLALRIIATRMASRPRWRVVDWVAALRDERGRLDELVLGDLDARACLMVSIDQLAASTDAADRRAARLFPLLGAAAVTSHTAASVAALSGHTPAEAHEAMERLTDAQIVSSPAPGAYVLHDLVRAAAVGQADELPGETVRSALTGLARWYLGTLYRVSGALEVREYYRRRCAHGAERFPEGLSFDRAESALAWADSALDDVVALARRLADDLGAEEGGEGAGADGLLPGFALEACRALEGYFGIRLSWQAQERLCTIALRVAERRGDPHGRAVALGQLGKAAGQRGEGARGVGLLERSVELFRSLGEGEETVGVLNNLVPCLASCGRLDDAVRVGREALAEAERHGLGELTLAVLSNLGRCHLLLGQREEALRLLTRVYQEASFHGQRASTASLLAEYHLQEGELEEAARWAGWGLAQAGEPSVDAFQMARLYALRAVCLHGLGRLEQAREEDGKARALIDELNEREAAQLSVWLDSAVAACGVPGAPSRG